MNFIILGMVTPPIPRISTQRCNVHVSLPPGSRLLDAIPFLKFSISGLSLLPITYLRSPNQRLSLAQRYQ